ncbi:MAG: MoaD/ThiS family protein [Elusimicrobiota bacterium]|nr:MoaD/ThiS family protein [Elusimicrobiota bacterium]
MTKTPAGTIQYRILACANLRHYLPGANETASVETKRPLTGRALLRKLKIPEGEVMAVTVEGKAVDLDRVIEKSCAVEILPVLSGG